MAIKTLNELKAYFETGDTPTQEQFGDLIDSTYRGYKVYTAIISQTGTNAPTVYSELENTLGGIVWSRSAQGRYLLTLTGAFPDQKKVFVIFGAADYSEVGDPAVLKICKPTYYYDTVNRIAIESYLDQQGIPSNGQRDDGLLNKQHIEIRVYN